MADRAAVRARAQHTALLPAPKACPCGKYVSWVRTMSLRVTCAVTRAASLPPHRLSTPTTPTPLTASTASTASTAFIAPTAFTASTAFVFRGRPFPPLLLALLVLPAHVRELPPRPLPPPLRGISRRRREDRLDHLKLLQRNITCLTHGKSTQSQRSHRLPV